jgi:hypothetical protein
MRAVAAAPVMLVAACGTSPATPPRDLQLDVVVDDGNVHVFFNGTDSARPDWPTDEMFFFPAPGECLQHDDVSQSSGTCLEDVWLDDMHRTPLAAPAWFRTSGIADHTLGFSGCGYSSIEIAIPAFEPIDAMIQVTATSLTVDASWPITGPRYSTDVRFYEGLWSYECHTVDGHASLTLPSSGYAGSTTYVDALQLLPPLESTQERVTARVWRGTHAGASVQIPMQ